MPTNFNCLKFPLLLLFFINNLNAQNITYVNSNNSINTNSFEACIGDQVTFSYTGFSNNPDTLILTNGSGPYSYIQLTNPGNIIYNNVTINNVTTYNGTITITIPPNASTGNVALIENGLTVYNFSSSLLVIHKPPVNFHLPLAPLCATDTIPLIGTPAGGTFSTTPSALISDSSLIGINAGWSTTINDTIKNVDIFYTYTPKYISGLYCPNPIITSQTVQIRDNRLDTLEFQYIVTSDTPRIIDRVILDIGSPIVQKISPDFPINTYPVSFIGNYVNQINGADIFFIEDAGYGNHPITMQYNNGGCIGELTTNLDVLQPLQLSGVVDTLCKYASPITITRDSRPEYAYTNVTTTSAGITTQKESNIIISVSTKNPNYQSAITLVNSNTNQEEYTFDPTALVLPPNLDTIVIIMHYKAYKTITIDTVVSIKESPISTIEYLITLVNRPTVNFTLDTTYCKNSTPVRLVSTPAFYSPSSFFTYASSTSASGPFLAANRLHSNEFNPYSIYTQAGFQNQDLHVQLTYTVDQYGCVDSSTQSTKINPIPNVSLNGLATSYCINNPLVQLSGLPINSAATYTGSGITDTVQGTFSPAIAGAGTTTITYSIESGNGCKSSISQTTNINTNATPRPSFPQSQYCASDLPVLLDTAYTYWGNIIDSTNILNPQRAVGQQTVFYISTSNLVCSDTSSTTILINQLPTITINSLDSAYCFNGSVDNNIFIYPPVPSLGNINGSSLGFNFNSAGGVTFDPDFDSTGIKSFKYKYTDNLTNCTDSVLLSITVYDVPALSYTGINPTYCNVSNFNAITGIPSGGVFSGAGISSDTTGQYYFNPFLPVGGNQTLNYSTVYANPLLNSLDTLFCPIDINIPIVINQLPTLAFSGPQNSHRFCSNEADTLLAGVTITPTWELFTSTTPGAINTKIDTIYLSVIPYRILDTSYFFSPNSAGPGVHHITYTGIDRVTGCQDTKPFTYYITDYQGGASFTLDTAYCASSDSVLMGGTPAGGTFLRNQDTLSSAFFTLSTDIYLLDTITYQVTYDACVASDTQFAEINPLVDLSFTGNKPSKRYCTGDEDSPLLPNILGGTFSGEGVIFGDSLFSLLYANLGDNIITYKYINSVTLCESSVSDTFFAYGLPNINFQAVGGCQLDNIFFHPENTILGLNNVIDSITSIFWELEPGLLINGSSNSNNKIDSINHIYNAPGVYETKLYVANRTYCVDTTTVRVVISPTIRSHQFPYDETFENSNGNWYAETGDSSDNLLWEWGRDTIQRGINNPNNSIWATQLNDQYTANEAAWVYSPCFDISNLERPMIRFDYWSDSRDRGDGTVLEFQNPNGDWLPLGKLNRGINWFNSGYIAGSPGNQSNQALSPIGWSGQIKRWINSRYKLDEFKNTLPSKLRLRMAFGSSKNNLATFHNGFAFDNVWIGSRTRNVLLETTSHIDEPNMDYVNNYVYQLVYHTNINKDVILLQYHIDKPNKNDQFYLFNPPLSNSIAYFYSITEPGTAVIDGINDTIKSKLLNDRSFEQNMLESPKFNVEIDTFYHNNPGQFTLTSTITALIDIPALEQYRINMVITEDSLSYTNGEKVHAVVRKSYPSNTINTLNKSWVAGEQVTLTHTYSATDLNYVPNRFQAVVFIQVQLTKEIFQAATTRDVNGYWVGVDQIISEKELNEIKDMNLYPNPAKDYITIDFPELLKKDYNWKLISIAGITVKEDIIHTGEQSLKINNYDLPSGVYIFMVYNGNVYSQRKVIINQD
jgi:hypothetical protein